MNYAFSVSHTTHIVCTNLCASKLKSFSSTRPLKKRIHVVHPNWIIDSLKSNELQPESKYEIIIAKDTTSILDYMPSEGTNKSTSKAHSSEVSNASEEPIKDPPNSMSLSLSTDESQESPSPYKRVTHPLLHSRRSSASSHRDDSLRPSLDHSHSRVQVSMKQSRINSIMKRTAVQNAQKSFR